MKQLIGGGSGPAGPAGPAGAITAVPAGTAAAPSIAFEGDSNTGIYSPGADQVAISTNGTEKLIVKSDGKVGLGTSSPSQLFHLAANNCNLHLQPVSNAEARIQAEGGTAGTGTAITFHNYNGVSNGERVRIDGSGRVGIGTTSPNGPLEVIGTAATIAARATTGVSSKAIQIYNNGTDSYIDSTAYGAGSGGGIAFRKNGTGEMGRFDTSGRLLVGTSTARANFYNSSNTARLQVEGTSADIGFSRISCVFNDPSANGDSIIIGKTRGSTVGSATVVVSQDNIGYLSFQAADGTELVEAASISAAVDGTPGANDMPGRLVFSTTADGLSSPTERMRISANGAVSIGTTGTSLGATNGVIVGALESSFTVSTAGQVPIRIYNKDTAGTRYCMEFRSASTAVGSITHDGTNTSYTTSSDYRLKENVTVVTNGITRLQQLKPSRFNFISNPNKTVEGFIAHEAQAVVPECVTGTKDAVDADGNPVYQGIDQSKLVPLLTAALQEAIAKIESLETRLSALEGA